MKKVAIVAALAVALIAASAGVVVAQTANPSSSVLYDPDTLIFSTPPTDYAEGVTIQEVNVAYDPGCYGTGIVTTTRLGDQIVQEAVITDPGEPSVDVGQHCVRTGSFSGWWNSGFTPTGG